MRLAIYARVSTREQTVDLQLETVRAYAKARGAEVAGEYLDEGVSGAKDRRPALDRLLTDARRRRFDAVVCTKLDRLARSTRHLTNLAADLEAVGVDLVVIDQREPNEVAEELGISLDSVYAAKHRCTAQLRTLMRELNQLYESE